MRLTAYVEGLWQKMPEGLPIFYHAFVALCNLYTALARGGDYLIKSRHGHANFRHEFNEMARVVHVCGEQLIWICIHEHCCLNCGLSMERYTLNP